MYDDFLFGFGIILICLVHDIGPCVGMNRAVLGYAVAILGMFVFC